VSSVLMANGYYAYPLAYFSQQTPLIGSLVATWREQTYSFRLKTGDPAWSMPNDPWDFDLEPWVNVGKVLWIDPSDPQQPVQGGPWKTFPFKDVQGQRLHQTIVADQLRTSPPPDGVPFQPFE
jgi:hypothetical protein